MTYSVEVVSNTSVNIESLSVSELRRIYSMRQLRWPNNATIIVFALPSTHDLHKQFTKERLRIFPYQLDRIWNKLTFSGLGVTPTIMNTQEELLQAVINTPGSIGYVESLNKAGHVHVIKIEE